MGFYGTGMSDRSGHELELCQGACCLLRLLENVFLFERGPY